MVEPREDEEEMKEAIPFEKEKWAVNWDQVYRRYWVGNWKSTEFGLEHNGINVKVEIKYGDESVRIIIDDRCYVYRCSFCYYDL